jgi:hypothetical protein
MDSIDLSPIKEPSVEDFECEEVGPLHEWQQTDKITILMEAVRCNCAKGVDQLLSMKSIIWNQRGPCGRKPEQVAYDLGYWEIHAMLVAKREMAQLQASVREGEKKEPLRL